MAITFYSSADAGAPVLSGTGDITTVLDAILINGYGSKPAAGWTKPFTGTNKVAYRMASGAGQAGYYLRIQDQLDSGRGYRWRSYKTMSDVDTGTNPVPTVAQMAGDGFYGWKSTTNDTTARWWFAVADATGLMFVVSQDTTPTARVGSLVGHYIYLAQIESYIDSSDTAIAVMGSSTNTTAGTANTADLSRYLTSTNYTANANAYISTSYMGLEGSFAFAKRSKGFDQSNTSGAGVQEFPFRNSGRVLISRTYICEGASGNWGTIRGHLPFLFSIPSQKLSDATPIWGVLGGSTLEGNGLVAGKNFFIFHGGISGNSSIYGVLAQASGDR